MRMNLSTAPMQTQRSSLSVTLSVWHALLLREALSRLFHRRAAWVWLLLEPIAHVLFLVVVFTAIRVTHIGGIEAELWLIVGMLAYFVFNRTGSQGGNAVKANLALFTYRQVKPVDTVLVRCLLEFALMLFVSLILLLVAGIWGLHAIPHDPLGALVALFGLWLLGVGYALIYSVVTTMVSEMQKVLDIAMLPLYMASGTMVSLSAIPAPYREWLMLNPVAHGLEAMRLAFAPYYHAAPELSIDYLYRFAVVLVFIGLLMHSRLQERLIAQ